jgi:hypothetical protein
MCYFKTRLNIKMANSNSHCSYENLLLSWTVELEHIKILYNYCSNKMH